MQLEMINAFVLHTRPWRETSIILDLFGEHTGRFSALAKGARRPKSTWRNALQIFQPVWVWAQGRGELLTVTQLEEHGQHYPLRGELLSCGLYMNELLLRLLPIQDPHPEVFTFYQSTLSKLVNGSPEWHLRCFEKQLLDALGYGLVLDFEGGGGESLDPERLYHYQVEHGPVRPLSDQDAGVPIHGRCLQQLSRGGEIADPECLASLKRLMRYVLQYHLGDRPLQSRSLFQHIL